MSWMTRRAARGGSGAREGRGGSDGATERRSDGGSSEPGRFRGPARATSEARRHEATKGQRGSEPGRPRPGRPRNARSDEGGRRSEPARRRTPGAPECHTAPISTGKKTGAKAQRHEGTEGATCGSQETPGLPSGPLSHVMRSGSRPALPARAPADCPIPASASGAPGVDNKDMASKKPDLDQILEI